MSQATTRLCRCVSSIFITVVLLVACSHDYISVSAKKKNIENGATDNGSTDNGSTENAPPENGPTKNGPDATVQTPPPDPTGLTATATSAIEIQLSWASGGGSTAGYRVAYTTGTTAPASCASGVSVDESPYTARELIPSTVYSFRVCAINGNNPADVSSGAIAENVQTSPLLEPVITSFSPSQGLYTGGTRIEIDGSHFLGPGPGGPRVYLGDIGCDVTSSSDSSLICIAGSQPAPRPYRINVVTADGRKASSQAFFNSTGSQSLDCASERSDFGGGLGTAESPYQICSRVQLENVGSYTGAYFVLVSNIQLSLDSPFDPLPGLSGSFDGNGFAIVDVKIAEPFNPTVGVFRQIFQGGSVRNLTVELGPDSASVEGSTKVGVITGENWGTIENCHVTGEGAVIGTSYLGGIVGSNYGSILNSSVESTVTISGTGSDIGGLVGRNGWNGLPGSENPAQIRHCSSQATVKGQDYVGGLVGYTQSSCLANEEGKALVEDSSAGGSISGHAYVGGFVGGQDGCGRIRNSSFQGDVVGTYYSIGGFVGIQSGGTIENCHSAGTVTINGANSYGGGFIGSSQSNGIVSPVIKKSSSSVAVSALGSLYVGGFAGWMYGSGSAATSRIETSYATGSVSGASYVGGFVGLMSGSSKVDDSYAQGAATGWGSYVGGFLGSGTAATATMLSRVYSTGRVNAGSFHGGLVGYLGGSYISNSFWDIETSGMTGQNGGTGLSTDEMKRSATYIGVNWELHAPPVESDIWRISEGSDYPRLAWEYE